MSAHGQEPEETGGGPTDRPGGFGSGEFDAAEAPPAGTSPAGGTPGGPHEDDRIAEHDPEGLDVASRVAHRLSGLLPPVRVGPQRPRRHREFGEQRSGAHPDERDPQKLGTVFDDLVARRGWRRQLGLHLIVQRWDELVGPVNAQHSAPAGYEGGVLLVQTESSTWASALRLIAPQLVAELNRRLGDGAVTRVEVRGPSAPSWRHGPRSVPGRGPRDTYG